MDNLKERAKKFIDELGVKATLFSKNVGISYMTFYKWQKGDLKLSESTEQRISDYLMKYGF